MTLDSLITSLTDDTLLSLRLFGPELTLCATIVLMLLVRLFPWGRRVDMSTLTMLGSGFGFWLAVLPYTEGEFAFGSRTELFTGMLVYDTFGVYFRVFLMLFVFLFAIFTRLSGIPDREDGPDFYALVLGATLGMCLMATANHWLTIFLAVEMASVPSYVLAGMLKGRRRSSEAALKYAVYGAGTAGVMLYGISLLAGVLGSCHLPTMAAQLSSVLANPDMTDRHMVLTLGGLMVMVGLAFKLSAVPFHFWCPDVFEGASAEVDAFLSVASKAAALALLIRVVIGFSHVPEQSLTGPQPTTVEAPPLELRPAGTRVDAAALGGSQVVWPQTAIERALAPARRVMVLIIALFAAVTCTFGNLAAYGQTNLKRLLAYSTIAHAGYLMMPVAAGVALMDADLAEASRAFGAVAFYVGLYLFMNLGAFAIVAFLRNAMRSEEIADYAGLIRSCPGMAVCLSILLLSLVGLPPLAGFAAKWGVFAAIYTAIQHQVGTQVMWVLLWVAGLNTAVSLFYYLRVVKVMTMEPERPDRVSPHLPMVSLQGAYVFALTLPVLGLGIFWDQLYRLAHLAAGNLLT